jgi:hypothetical protein
VPTTIPLVAWKEFIAGLGIELSPENMRAAIEDPEQVGPRVFFQTVPEPKTVKNRVHLDVRAAPGLDGDERMDALEAECTRLTELGGARLRRVDPDPPLETRLSLSWPTPKATNSALTDHQNRTAAPDEIVSQKTTGERAFPLLAWRP